MAGERFPRRTLKNAGETPALQGVFAECWGGEEKRTSRSACATGADESGAVGNTGPGATETDAQSVLGAAVLPMGEHFFWIPKRGMLVSADSSQRVASASILPMRFPARFPSQSPGCWWWGRVLACDSFGRSLPSLGAWLPSAPRRKFRGACFLRRGTVGTGPIVKTRTALQPAGCGANVRAAPSVQSRRRGTSGTDCVGPRRRFPKSMRLRVHRATPKSKIRRGSKSPDFRGSR
jgi:hypothetical protein